MTIRNTHDFKKRNARKAIVIELIYEIFLRILHWSKCLHEQFMNNKSEVSRYHQPNYFKKFIT